jgi:hypothetical protein
MHNTKKKSKKIKKERAKIDQLAQILSRLQASKNRTESSKWIDDLKSLLFADEGVGALRAAVDAATLFKIRGCKFFFFFFFITKFLRIISSSIIKKIII